MEQLKLLNGNVYDLATNGVLYLENEKLQITIFPGEKSFSEIEADFDSQTNIQRIEILDSSGEPMNVKKDYAILESIKKQKDYIIRREETQDSNEEKTYQDLTGVAYILLLSKPDLREQVKNLQETVDTLVLSELGA